MTFEQKFLLLAFIFFKQLYFMKSICWYHIWSYKNTNLLNVCMVLCILHIWCSISSLNLSSYKKWRNSILLSSSNLLHFYFGICPTYFLCVLKLCRVCGLSGQERYIIRLSSIWHPCMSDVTLQEIHYLFLNYCRFAI